MFDIVKELENLLENYSELDDCYCGLSEEYKDLEDNDPLTAFSIMKMSSSLQSSFEKLAADVTKLVICQEKYAKATHARRSCELSDKPTDGERKAAKDVEVLGEWEIYARIFSLQKIIESTARELGRIYYDCKAIWEQANRKYRENRGV